MPTNQEKNGDIEGKLLAEFDQWTVQTYLEFVKKVVLVAFQHIAIDSRDVGLSHGSPVWSGRFLASHNVSLGEPDYTVADPNPETVGRGATRWPDEPDEILRQKTQAIVAAKLANLKPFEPVFIANGLPYARKIELGGFSLKAPEGVYNVTAEYINQRFANAKATVLDAQGE